MLMLIGIDFTKQYADEVSLFKSVVQCWGNFLKAR